MLRLSYLVLATLLMLTPALAHTGIGETTGFAHGFSHPVGGMDHVLAMIAVGLFAALLGGRALWRIGLGLAIGRMSELRVRRVAQMTGGSIALAGIAILAHSI